MDFKHPHDATPAGCRQPLRTGGSSSDRNYLGIETRLGLLEGEAPPEQVRRVRPALLEPGDTFMGMSLAAGGHLTHGAPPNQSGKWFDAVQYGVRREDARVDFDEVERLAKEHRPKLIVAGGSAYPRFIDFARFRAIADEVGALFMVDMAHFAGLVAGGVHPNPLDHAHVATTTTHKTLRGPRGGIILARSNEALEKKFNSAVFPGGQGGPLMHVIAAKAVSFKEAMGEDFKVYQQQVVDNARAMAKTFIERGIDIVSGGTDNHLMLVSLIDKGITGKDADAALGRANITVNKNAVPNDPQSPFVTSGIRIGTGVHSRVVRDAAPHRAPAAIVAGLRAERRRGGVLVGAGITAARAGAG